MTTIIEVIRAIREVRSVEKLPSGLIVRCRVAPQALPNEMIQEGTMLAQKSGDEISRRIFKGLAEEPGLTKESLQSHREIMERLTRAKIDVVDSVDPVNDDVEFAYPVGAATVVVELPNTDDTARETLLSREIGSAEAAVGRLQNSLSNTEFLAKAPPEVVKRTEEKLAAAQSALLELRKRRRGRPNE
jgi:valyl-tRNA synthetase